MIGLARSGAKPTKIHHTALAVIALTASLSTVPIAHAHDAPSISGAQVVVTNTGPVQGSVNAKTIAFLGIPYAKPPVGDLRWRPPQPHGHWTSIRTATQFGKHCPQLPPVSDPNASEDCLFLNVYVPRTVAVQGHSFAQHPVMVWLHGGANASGASEMYDPTPLVETGNVIVVTLNYRLGPLGFLAHPALDANGANYGVMDQQRALRWLRTNISRFGGDPQNVTLFGESAGGLDIFTHLVSPRSAGLIDKVIMQSGAYGLNAATLDQSEGLGVTFANAIGCTDQTAACLRSKPVGDVMAHGANAFNQSTVDGHVLREPPLAALQAGRINRVPVIQGANRHEGRFFISRGLTEAGYHQTVFGIAAATGKPADQIRARYPLSASPFEVTSALYGDAAFACTAEATSRIFARSVRTYAYEFADPGASPMGEMHTAELKYLVNLNLGGSIVGPSSLSAPSQVLAARMREYWTRFAHSGNPNSRGEAEWKPVSAGQVLSLIAPSPSARSIADYRAEHQCAFWD